MRLLSWRFLSLVSFNSGTSAADTPDRRNLETVPAARERFKNGAVHSFKTALNQGSAGSTFLRT